MPPTGIPAAKLNQMRTNVLKMLPDTCTIQRVAKVSDGSGGKQRGATTVATGVPCRIEPDSDNAQSDLGLNARVDRFKWFGKWDAPIARDCQIVHGGYTYEIWQLEDDMGPIVYRKARIQRISA